MSRTFTSLLTHVVFSTKDREPLINADLKPELYAYLGGLTRELKGKAYGINGAADHVHMLISCRQSFRCLKHSVLSSLILPAGSMTNGPSVDHSDGSLARERLA